MICILLSHNYSFCKEPSFLSIQDFSKLYDSPFGALGERTELEDLKLYNLIESGQIIFE